jgi:hypothetical protein
MNLIIRKASIRWTGGAKGGSRAVTTESGVLKPAKFSLATLLKNNGSSTDPAELIAAAHASSFSLALSNELGLKAFAAGEIVTFGDGDTGILGRRLDDHEYPSECHRPAAQSHPERVH